ncbi:hypothetical protein KL938_002751 [Ogataea parapolymorpha]|nr:hypothetical protein KL938_002751 [Ogataea parapolymorpha]
MNTDVEFWEFRKLHDKNDTLLDKVEKQCFRYALPNLPLGLPAFRRYSSSLARIVLGSAFFLGGSHELSYAWRPYENPLYVETCLARDKAMQDGEESTYWLGPKNYMPMTISQYFDLIWMQYLTRADVEKVMRSKILAKFNQYHEKYAESLRDAATLGSRVQRVIDQPAPKHAISKDEVSSIIGAFHTDEDLTDPDVVEKYWFENHPWIKLQVLTNTMYLASNIPRVAQPKNNQTEQTEQPEQPEQLDEPKDAKLLSQNNK